MSLSILYVGPVSGTCRQRAEALRSLGHRVRLVEAEQPRSFWRGQLARLSGHLKRPLDLHHANRIIQQAAGEAPDILWIDKGRTIRPATLRRFRQNSPRTAMVAYSPDDMLNPNNQSTYYLRCIPLFDLHVTTKSYNVEELKGLGARDVLFIDNAYDPETHKPVTLQANELARYGCEVGFIGGYEEDRAEQMLWLADNQLQVSVWGYAWDRFHKPHARLTVRNEQLDELEYSKCISATKINLGFLRKVNRDLQTTRSIEIPACGAFLLAERTDEHRRLFEEGREAEFFSSREELLQKCRYYLEHEPERNGIAAAGRRRCVEGGYSNSCRLNGVIDYVLTRGAGIAAASSAR